MANIFDDYPQFTAGRIGYGTLYKIIEWEQRHGINNVSRGTIDACREEGLKAAQAGLELGLIDYGQATGCEDY